jgi:hypothetical protein
MCSDAMAETLILQLARGGCNSSCALVLPKNPGTRLQHRAKKKNEGIKSRPKKEQFALDGVFFLAGKTALPPP